MMHQSQLKEIPSSFNLFILRSSGSTMAAKKIQRDAVSGDTQINCLIFERLNSLKIQQTNNSDRYTTNR